MTFEMLAPLLLTENNNNKTNTNFEGSEIKPEENYFFLLLPSSFLEVFSVWVLQV